MIEGCANTITRYLLSKIIHRKNVILADCVCRQEISSRDYTQHTDPPVTTMATRQLQQAMVPGEHLKSVHLLCSSKDELKKFSQSAASVILSSDES